MSMDAESFKKAVHPLLNGQGFVRSGATWRKEQDESVAVFNVQKSGFGGGTYYLNIGVYYHALGNDMAPAESQCHVRRRLDLTDPETVAAKALEWFAARSTLTAAAALAEEDSKKGLVFKEVRHAT